MKKILMILTSTIVGFALLFTVSGCGSDSGDKNVEATESTTAEVTTEVFDAELADIYETIAGEYQDSVSQRASATVIADPEGEIFMITVYWSRSASETDEWVMNAKFKDGKLVYQDCKRNLLIGDSDVEVQYENGEGYFEIGDEGKILWTGAADEDCQSCVFERMEE